MRRSFLLLSIFAGVSAALLLLVSSFSAAPAAAVSTRQLSAPLHKPAQSLSPAEASEDLSIIAPVVPHMLLQRNPTYYDAASVVITEVNSLFIDQDQAWTQYQAGALDSITPPQSALPSIRASATYSAQLQIYPASLLQYFGMSNDVPPFDNPLVRQAFAAATDRQRLINESQSGDEAPALTLTPPGNFGHVDGYATGVGIPYSPTLAVQLLSQAGLTTTPAITLAFNSGHRALAQSARQMWYETLGISVTLQEMPWSSYLDLLDNGAAAQRPGIYRLGWIADYPDANNWHNDLVVSGKSWTRYYNPAYEALVLAAASEPDPAVRLDLYKQAESFLVMTDTALIPLYYGVNHALTRPDVMRTYRGSSVPHLDEWSTTGSPRPLEVAWGFAPVTIDPAKAADLASFNHIEQLFLGLTDIDPLTGAVVPELATGWSVSPDGLVYTMTLRNDAFWTDGKPVTAFDVEYGVLRSLDPAMGWNSAFLLYILQNAQEYKDGIITDPGLVGVKTLDASRVRFTLNSPASYFPMIAGLMPARPQPKWAIDAYGDSWTDPAHIVTNGPYMLAEWQQAPQLRIEKTAGGEAGQGGNLVFRIEVFNDGGAPADNVTVRDMFTGPIAYLGDNAGVPIVVQGTANGPFIWNLGTLAPNSSVGFDVAFQVTGAPFQAITNTALVTTSTPFDMGQPADKASAWSGSILFNDTHLNINKDAWIQDPAPDNPLTFSINVCNDGSTASSQVVLTDTLHPATRIISWESQPPNWWQVESLRTDQLVLSRVSLPGYWCGEILIHTLVNAAAVPGDTISNTAVISAANDLESFDNTASWQGQVGPPHSNLSVRKSIAWGELVPGGEIGYNIDYSNEGNVPVSGPIFLTDTLPVSTTFKSAFRWTPDGQQSMPAPVVNASGQVVWVLNGLQPGEGDSFLVTLNIDNNAIPGLPLFNQVEISPQPDEDRYDDNVSSWLETVNFSGPNLRVSKQHQWNGNSQLGYEINAINTGDVRVDTVFITDTYPVSTTFNGSWSHDYPDILSVFTSTTQVGWQFGPLDPGQSARIWFDVDLDAGRIGQPLNWYTNTVAVNLPPGDSNPADNFYSDVAFSGGEVKWVDLYVGDDEISVQAAVPPVTITTAFSQTVFPFSNVNWFSGVPILPGDTITVEAGSGRLPVVINVPAPFDAQADSQTDQVSGSIDALVNEPVEVDLYGGPIRQVQTDAGGNFLAQFLEIPRGADGEVRYQANINFADVTFHKRFRAPDLILRANYAHDWVGGDFPVSHTVTITVTDAGGAIKDTATLTTTFGAGWGGDGFQSNDADWSAGLSPDIVPGDWVSASMDTGDATQLQVSIIAGDVDVGNDAVSGRVYAPWFDQLLDVECHPWGAWSSGFPNASVLKSVASPDGTLSYFCQWPAADWDIQPGQELAVVVRGLDGNQVINVFTSNDADLAVAKVDSPDPVLLNSPLRYSLAITNNGPLTATGVTLLDRLPVGVSFQTSSSPCTPFAGNVACNFGDLLPGQSVTATIVVTPEVTGRLVNLAMVGSSENDPLAGNDSVVADTLVIDQQNTQPVILAISPDSGVNDQATNITILGYNFQQGITVALGATPLPPPTWISQNLLKATVPAGFTPGTYDLSVTNPDGSSATLLEAFSVLQPLPPAILGMTPNYGPNDVPVIVDIFGFNFAPDATAALISTLKPTGPRAGAAIVQLKGVLFVSSNHLRAIVPRNIPAGLYALRVTNPSQPIPRADTLPNAYEAFDASLVDDLFSSPRFMWLNPPSVRAGEAISLGLVVHRQGGNAPLFNVEVDFWEGDPSSGGNYLGRTQVPFLPPDDHSSTNPINWSPARAGTYDLFAVIDPDGAITETKETNNTISRTVIVLPRQADALPPIVTGFQINDGDATTSMRQVSLDVTAVDNPGGSGVAYVLYIEYVYNPYFANWEPVQVSGWLPFASASADYNWLLRPVSGIHYVQAWVADRAGNISTTPGSQFIAYLADQTFLAAGEVHVYRHYLDGGESLLVRLNVLNGNSGGAADFYVWDPDSNLVDFRGSVNGIEEIEFTATISGVYQIEIEGLSDVVYQLEILPAAVAQAAPPGLLQPQSPTARFRPFIAIDDTPDDDGGGPPSAPPGELGIYLPAIMKK